VDLAQRRSSDVAQARVDVAQRQGATDKLIVTASCCLRFWVSETPGGDTRLASIAPHTRSRHVRHPAAYAVTPIRAHAACSITPNLRESPPPAPHQLRSRPRPPVAYSRSAGPAPRRRTNGRARSLPPASALARSRPPLSRGERCVRVSA